MMKKEIRLIGIDDAPFDKFNDNEVLVVGTIFRGGNFMDGVVSTKVDVDGDDSTDKIAEMINKCKFKPQLQAIILDGIAVGGFNVIDIEKLNKKTNLSVIVVMRDYPDLKKIKSVLKKLHKEDKIELLKKAGKVYKAGKIHVQVCGIDLEAAKEILKLSCTHSYLPEPIRIAHLIASGVTEGESRGRA